MWTLSLDDHVWTADHLSADGACSVAALVGRGWASINPLNGPEETATLLAVLLAETTGVEYAVAQKRVKDLSAAELLACLGEVSG